MSSEVEKLNPHYKLNQHLNSSEILRPNLLLGTQFILVRLFFALWFRPLVSIIWSPAKQILQARPLELLSCFCSEHHYASKNLAKLGWQNAVALAWPQIISSYPLHPLGCWNLLVAKSDVRFEMRTWAGSRIFFSEMHVSLLGEEDGLG